MTEKPVGLESMAAIRDRLGPIDPHPAAMAAARDGIDAGYKFGAGAERAAIVAYLRRRGDAYIADALEHGAHEEDE
jgi:hypothetical protein